MIRSEVASRGRRRFFGAFGLGLAAIAAAAKNPLSLLTLKQRGRGTDPASAVAITPHPLAVERTQKGTAQHG